MNSFAKISYLIIPLYIMMILGSIITAVNSLSLAYKKKDGEFFQFDFSNIPVSQLQKPKSIKILGENEIKNKLKNSSFINNKFFPQYSTVEKVYFGPDLRIYSSDGKDFYPKHSIYHKSKHLSVPYYNIRYIKNAIAFPIYDNISDIFFTNSIFPQLVSILDLFPNYTILINKKYPLLNILLDKIGASVNIACNLKSWSFVDTLVIFKVTDDEFYDMSPAYYMASKYFSTEENTSSIGYIHKANSSSDYDTIKSKLSLLNVVDINFSDDVIKNIESISGFSTIIAYDSKELEYIPFLRASTKILLITDIDKSIYPYIASDLGFDVIVASLQQIVSCGYCFQKILFDKETV